MANIRLLTFAFCNIAALFLSRFDRMATNIGSMAAGLDERVIRLGIGRKGFEKRGETVALTFPM
jgi:hypothetical protein